MKTRKLKPEGKPLSEEELQSSKEQYTKPKHKTIQSIWPWAIKKGYDSLDNEKRQSIFPYKKVTISKTIVDNDKLAKWSLVMEDDSHEYNIEWEPIMFSAAGLEIPIGAHSHSIIFNKDLKTVSNWKKLILQLQNTEGIKISNCYDVSYNHGSFRVKCFEPLIFQAIDSLIGNAIDKETQAYIDTI